ncbi:MAG: hypothetical protein ACR2P2_02325 [Nakamurella sp.]
MTSTMAASLAAHSRTTPPGGKPSNPCQIGDNWGLALVVMAVAGLLGTVGWLFVHPERPLRQSAPALTEHSI